MLDHSRSKGGARRGLAVWVVAAVALLGATGDALAQGGGFTSPLIIPAAEFEHSGLDADTRSDRFSEAYGFVTTVTTTFQTTVMAPVYLPNGVTITRFEAAVADLIVENPSSASTCPRFYPDVEVYLMSTYYDDNVYPQDTQIVTHASVTSQLDTGQTHIVADTSIATPVVDNLNRMYWVKVSFCSQIETFQAVRIHYEE